ncbi:hypothetical protein CWATWH0402_1810 [Crocosphaera watsonii WH 0402]|uniref:Uncharacterized protein n=1 Tax=Crocosphaera watsonii WH 0402 TaxID=1284629 RepID=T2K0E2_CROWT|nr:hypothetical protein CWATWH0402_1810 [Crocosphaera watsonii WH 0402]
MPFSIDFPVNSLGFLGIVDGQLLLIFYKNLKSQKGEQTD